MRCLVSKVAPSVEKCREIMERLGGANTKSTTSDSIDLAAKNCTGQIIARASPSTSLVERRTGGSLWLEILGGQ